MTVFKKLLIFHETLIRQPADLTSSLETPDYQYYGSPFSYLFTCVKKAYGRFEPPTLLEAG